MVDTFIYIYLYSFLKEKQIRYRNIRSYRQCQAMPGSDGFSVNVDYTRIYRSYNLPTVFFYTYPLCSDSR